MTVQLEMPEIAIRTVEVSDIVIEWSVDEDGYNNVSDYLGRYIHSSGESKHDVVIDRENGYMLGEDVDKEGIACRWFKKQAKTLSGYRRAMSSYYSHYGQREYRNPIHSTSDINFELLFELEIDSMAQEAGFDIDSETGRRILAHTHCIRYRSCDAKWFEPSTNYNLRNGNDWDSSRTDAALAMESEMKAFNHVSHWPPVDQSGKRLRKGRKVKPYNGWRKYGIDPDISKLRPGFWVNVFYACEDHERLEEFNDGDWQMMCITARAKINTYDSVAGGERELVSTDEIETGWTGGYDSDSEESDFKAVEEEKLDELRHEAEAAGAIWPNNPDVEHEGETPY